MNLTLALRNSHGARAGESTRFYPHWPVAQKARVSAGGTLQQLTASQPQHDFSSPVSLFGRNEQFVQSFVTHTQARGCPDCIRATSEESGMTVTIVGKTAGDAVITVKNDSGGWATVKVQVQE